MSWLPIILLAAVAFVLAAFVLRLPRTGWSILGAALMLGLAGYALQGHPGYAGAPKDAASKTGQDGAAMVEARRRFFDTELSGSQALARSDALAQQGEYTEAAAVLRNALRDDAGNGEAWLALGNILIEHADGFPTPAAIYAYERAEFLLPEHPAPLYFSGGMMLRAGRVDEARQLWGQALANAPDEAVWKDDLEQEIEALDRFLSQ